MEAKEHTFIPTRDPQIGMPVGMRQFIDALLKAIKGESIPGNMSEEDKFAKKLSEFVGLNGIENGWSPRNSSRSGWWEGKECQ